MPSTRSPNTPAPEAPQDQLTVVRKAADALYRGAVECCRQHDRAAKLFGNEEPDLEVKHVDAMCSICDNSLEELAAAYNKIAGNAQPAREEEWWRKANTMWHASREYERHHKACEDAVKKLTGKRNAEQLKGLQMEYELAASALLALRHAANDYLKTRPGLT